MKLLTVKQVAKTLAVSTKTVVRLIASGYLASHDVSMDPGGKYACYRISEDDLIAFLEERRQATQQTQRRRRK